MSLVILSLGNANGERLRPRVGDHWHAAYSVYDCDRAVAPFPDSMAGSDSGIHTHADSLIHLEVNSSRYTGPNANIGAFAEGVDLEVADDQLQGAGLNRAEGDRCGDEGGTIQLAVWDGAADDTPTVLTENIADYAPQDGQLVTLAFAPEGSEIPRPTQGAISQLGTQAAPPSSLPSQSTPSTSSEDTPSTLGESTTSTVAAEPPSSTPPSTP